MLDQARAFGLLVVKSVHDVPDVEPIDRVDRLSAYLEILLEYDPDGPSQRAALESYVEAFFPSVARDDRSSAASYFICMNHRGLPMWVNRQIAAAKTRNLPEKVTVLRKFFFAFLGAHLSVAKRQGASATTYLTDVRDHFSSRGGFKDAMQIVESESGLMQHIDRMRSLRAATNKSSAHFKQPLRDVEDVFAQIHELHHAAASTKLVFDKFVLSLAEHLTGCSAVLVDTKGEVRSLEKIFNKGRDCTRITDMVRSRLACETIADVTAAVESLVQNPSISVIKIRDHFAKAFKAKDGRWADCQVYFSFVHGPSKGFICEVQVAHKAFLAARCKLNDHLDYECARLADSLLSALASYSTSKMM